MKNRNDFELETTAPKSLREIVQNELCCTTYKGKSYPQEESIEDLLQRVYSHIEKQALEVYHSAEPWALRQWALGNILKDEVINENTAEVAHGLISPVIEWQDQQEFDPLVYFSNQINDLSPKTIKGYLLTAARFVGFVGRQRHYTDEDITRYLNYMRKRYDNDNTYHQEGIRLLQFLRSLPGADESRRLPGSKRRKSKIRKTYTHATPVNDMETLIWACAIDNIPYDMVARLIGSTVYGRRVGELVDFKVKVNGDGTATVDFPTRKGGEESPHPIPEALVPLLMVPIKPINEHLLQHRLRQICKKAHVNLPYRGGYHSNRRTVATIVKHAIKSDIDTHKFMRWAEPRELGILAQYDQTRYEDVDRLVLENHPMVKVWEQACPYILKFNRSYRLLYDNAH